MIKYAYCKKAGCLDISTYHTAHDNTYCTMCGGELTMCPVCNCDEAIHPFEDLDKFCRNCGVEWTKEFIANAQT